MDEPTKHVSFYLLLVLLIYLQSWLILQVINTTCKPPAHFFTRNGVKIYKLLIPWLDGGSTLYTGSPLIIISTHNSQLGWLPSVNPASISVFWVLVRQFTGQWAHSQYSQIYIIRSRWDFKVLYVCRSVTWSILRLYISSSDHH